MERIDKAIEKANLVLSRVKIERRGQELALRSSLPKKPGEVRGNKQRYICMQIQMG
ncbi:MAG: hypothetical protein AAFU78_21800 [Cyanobacteria bacterium J06633_2]